MKIEFQMKKIIGCENGEKMEKLEKYNITNKPANAANLKTAII